VKPCILICNDDGIEAPGILALYHALRSMGQLTVVAPHAEQSAVSHGITLANPLKVYPVRREGGFEGYAVTGTPVDCVKLAVTQLMARPPDVVVSGINLGPNAGVSVIYSGTVSAASEGVMLGIPAVAISLATFKNPLWETAAHVAPRIVTEVFQRGLPPDTLLNVNVPNRPVSELKGVRITRVARSRFVEIFHERTNPRGDRYFWLDGELQMLDDKEGTDLQALDDGFVSVTPLGLDRTRHDVLPLLGEWNLQVGTGKNCRVARRAKKDG